MLKKNLPSEILWAITLWVIPFTVFSTLNQGAYFMQGSHNAYLSFSLYASEVLIFFTGFLFLVELLLHKRKTKLHLESLLISGVILALSALSIVFATDKTAATLALIHVLAGLSIFLLLTHHITRPEKTQTWLLSALVFQSLLAILQIITQNSIGLSFLGEPNIGPDVSGVAKLSLFGHTLIRGYGTFPHANILAGFLGVGILLSLSLPKNKFSLATKIILGIGFFLAFSKAAIIALLLTLIFTKKLPKKISWALLGILITILLIKASDLLTSESFLERMQYLGISLAMLAEKPFGVGLSQFTAHIQDFSIIKLQPWQYQPVHNIYLLITNELGIWSAGALLGGLIYTFIKHKKTIAFILFLALIGLFDHYLFSLPQGILLGGGVLGLTYLKN